MRLPCVYDTDTEAVNGLNLTDMRGPSAVLLYYGPSNVTAIPLSLTHSPSPDSALSESD